VKQDLYAFNITRQSFISLGLRLANTPWGRLRGLLGRMRIRSDEGLWVIPSRGVHTVGLMFPIDLIYLDAELRVLHVVENLSPFRAGPLSRQSASVLELPARAVEESGTRVGDRLMIGTPDECERFLESSRQRSKAS